MFANGNFRNEGASIFCLAPMYVEGSLRQDPKTCGGSVDVARAARIA